MFLSPSVKADMFVAMVREHIVPHCCEFPGPNSIVVMDNAEVHRDPRVRLLIESTGARLFYLPAYANNLNPIEVGAANSAATAAIIPPPPYYHHYHTTISPPHRRPLPKSRLGSCGNERFVYVNLNLPSCAHLNPSHLRIVRATSVMQNTMSPITA